MSMRVRRKSLGGSSRGGAHSQPPVGVAASNLASGWRSTVGDSTSGSVSFDGPMFDEITHTDLKCSELRAEIAQIEEQLEHKRSELERTSPIKGVSKEPIKSESACFVISDATFTDNPVVFMTESFLRLVGYSRRQIFGLNIRFLQGPGTDPEAVERVRKAVESGTDVCETLLNYRSDGTAFWNQMFISPLRSSSGRVEKFIGVFNEVGDPREAAAMAAAAAAARPGPGHAAALAAAATAAAAYTAEAKHESPWGGEAKSSQGSSLGSGSVRERMQRPGLRVFTSYQPPKRAQRLASNIQRAESFASSSALQQPAQQRGRLFRRMQGGGGDAPSGSPPLESGSPSPPSTRGGRARPAGRVIIRDNVDEDERAKASAAPIATTGGVISHVHGSPTFSPKRPVGLPPRGGLTGFAGGGGGGGAAAGQAMTSPRVHASALLPQSTARPGSRGRGGGGAGFFGGRVA